MIFSATGVFSAIGVSLMMFSVTGVFSAIGVSLMIFSVTGGFSVIVLSTKLLSRLSILFGTSLSIGLLVFSVGKSKLCVVSIVSSS